MSALRPPLPPPLSHDEIQFVFGQASPGPIPPEILTTIAHAISSALPGGDFDVTDEGIFLFANPENTPLWVAMGRSESIDRSTR